VATLTVTGRADLTDAQWAVLEPLLPPGRKPGRPPKWTKRQLIDGIRWRVRAGAPWRDVPAQYGPWPTVYGLFRRWQRDGTWQQILTGLQAGADAAGLITWDPGLRRLLVPYLFAASLRCQPSSVAGVTGKMAVQRLRGRSRASAANHIRSAGSYRTRPTLRRHRVLVPEDEQLSILRQIAAECQDGQAEYPAN